MDSSGRTPDSPTPGAGIAGAATIDAFGADGYLVVRRAVATDIVRHCVDVIEAELRTRAVDPRDPATWTEPVVRFACPEGPAFAAAGTSPALRDTYDALLGVGRWARREGVGGTLPIRFPSGRDPGDAGWHIDGSYDVNGAWWVNVRSRGRGLLALFLFTDVGDDDAPTELIVGSHLDVPRALAPFGECGVFFGDVLRRLPRSTFERPRARATGHAGDVFLCHPFLVHRATWPHRGAGPRMVAQPSIAIQEPFALRAGPDVCPVERAILRGLGRPDEPSQPANAV
ncbi:MAG TPA: phytanoyl-CoA dioxygenase family protein [Candidatus Acidoferrum sp.]|jgi:hypothetical protein|nr:phytanoyl-CoA dioxygenase family protein [Candidatus Acidoferrum sp.]